MENGYFLNAGIQPPGDPSQQQIQIQNWNLISNTASSSPLDINPNPNPDPDPDCFFNSNWQKSTDQNNNNINNNNFESALSSLVSSPAASNSNISTESFMIRELIGKLGNINSNNSTNNSCYTTPLNSPPKLNTMPLSEFSADPGFAERAAKFSCFGSRSFNGRTTNHSHFNNNSINHNSGFLNGGSTHAKLTRVSSTPSLKDLGSLPVVLVSDHNVNSRKRKSASKGKAKESPLTNSTKAGETSDDSNAKRSRAEQKKYENSPSKTGKEKEKPNSVEEDEKQSNNKSIKPPEAPKDYIHVRARRGQATDSHSLAERVRREKISERMKLLQDLVPGCNKVTGKALMLDEIINYVQSLQRQVEFLSMKLASVNTSLDINMDTLLSKDMIHASNSMQFQLDSSASAFFGQNISSNGTVAHSLLDPLDTNTTTSLTTNLNLQLSHLNQFTNCLSQYSNFCEDDLQTIVQMGFGQNQNQETLTFPQHNGTEQTSHMKIEL